MGGGASSAAKGSAAAPASPPPTSLAATSSVNLRPRLEAEPTGAAQSQARVERAREEAEFDESGAELGSPPAALYLCAGRGDLARLRTLLETASEEDIGEPHWRSTATALHIAALQGHTDCLKLLLQKGADRAAVTADGLTPLHFAALGPSADCISALLDGAAGAELPAMLTFEGESALFLAVACCGLGWTGQDAVRALVAAGGSPLDTADSCGVTALHLAAFADEEECAAALVAAGASPSLADEGGATALSLTSSLPRMTSLLRNEPVEEQQSAWTRAADVTLVDEGEKLGRERSVTEALWSLGEAGSDDVNVLETPDTVLYKCVALFSREAENEEDLEFHKGAVIECLQEDVPGWVRNKHTRQPTAPL